MKLSNSKNVSISKNKLINYLLSETHPVGSSKAKFFRKLGFNNSNVDILIESFTDIAQSNEIKESRKLPYGTNYVVNGIIDSPSGKKVKISTVWFVEKEEGNPRFITAYPL
ncbi:MAG: hypothetical protein US96_C0011G0009 [Candidatus Woesebacteria bacterium GW2011_GWB1_38_5b]|uniref:DUF6883 domain-containing protein n=1 Tax=Candidatus Woesebacteria bacterium GW2011_GWB1_38_5b TaxID=1618569 RepID=A0A0G0NE70_9BACT|nr:MAG: hypothetical protein US96_C0011G0009 [Candidatus Woesebacteria bacterium GW2011_GWB1_38_5b]OGH47338.1 MAG: hypothetical protein A3A51_01025 [Candidatus Levybacteria bacterium RIFCSPLOWO2_01_FULL_39_10]